MAKITFCITTFLRPQVVKECIECIRKYYPTEKILVADQSPEEKRLDYSAFKHVGTNIEILLLPFDCGAPYSRNRLTEAVETEYCVIMDDDMFLKEHSIYTLLTILEDASLDICGGLLTDPRGVIQRWDGNLWVENECLHFEQTDILTPFTVVDIISTCFLGKTSSLLKVKWFEEYKIGKEHLDFFWNVKLAGLKVGLSPVITATHIHYRDSEYDKFRFRGNMDYNNNLLLNRLKVNSIKSSTYLNLTRSTTK